MIGAALAAAGAASVARLWPHIAAWPSSVQGLGLAYLGGWEAGVQRLGAGLLDAAVDTLAVMAGALVAWGLWAHRRGLVRGAAGALAVVLAVGVWRRRKGGDDA
jgi:hypothetical protein